MAEEDFSCTPKEAEDEDACELPMTPSMRPNDYYKFSLADRLARQGTPTRDRETPMPSKATTSLRFVMRRMEHAAHPSGSSSLCESQELAKAQGKARLVDLALSGDQIMHVFELLEDELLVICMCVSKKWNRLASQREIWQHRSEVNPVDGRIKWPSFQRLRVLRQKTHSMVVMCKSRKCGKLLVVKRVSTNVNPFTGEPQGPGLGFPVRYLREISLLKASNHPNVMRTYLVGYQDGRLDLFSEYVGQNMEDHIAELPVQSFIKGTDEHVCHTANCRSFMRQILSAVCYCHARGILLRDIKPRNVMLQEGAQRRVKLTGFALGRFAPLPMEPLTREVVTLSYRAPEILLGGPTPMYAAPVDMWSAGCTLAEMASGLTLFEGESEIEQLFGIFQKLGTPTEAMWPGVTRLPDFLEEPPQWKPKDLANAVPLCAEGLDLLSKMLRYDPKERITAKAALQHPFLSQHAASLQAGGDRRAEPCGQDDHKQHPAHAHAHAHAQQQGHQPAAEDQLPASTSTGGADLSSALSGNAHAEDLRNCLLSLEKAYLPAEVYKTHRQLRGFSAMRKMLVEWLVELVEEGKMKCETLFLAVNYLDRFLSLQEVQREKLQLVGITSVLIASKHEELAPQSVHNLVIMTDNTYHYTDVLSMERTLLRCLDYSITPLTPLRALEFLKLHIQKSGTYPPDGVADTDKRLTHTMQFMASFLLELALAEYDEAHTRPSHLSAAALLLAVHMMEVTNVQGGEPNATPIGMAGPCFSVAARCVWDAFGESLAESGDWRVGMLSLGAGMKRLHSYHLFYRNAPTPFATCRKYANPKRGAVSLVQAFPAFMLPEQFVMDGEIVRLIQPGS